MTDPRDTLPPVLREKLARARAEYGLKLVARLAELTELVLSARQGDTDAHKQAQRLAHQLCGTAGSFGFAEVSAALSEVDRDLLALISGASEPAVWTRIDEALKRASQNAAR